MRNFAVLGAAALLFALGVAQASATNQSGPAGPNIYSQAWQLGDTNVTRAAHR
ncbi:MAG: hypothetical protein ABSF67_16480 [Roseiarcus sp.]